VSIRLRHRHHPEAGLRGPVARASVCDAHSGGGGPPAITAHPHWRLCVQGCWQGSASNATTSLLRPRGPAGPLDMRLAAGHARHPENGPQEHGRGKRGSVRRRAADGSEPPAPGFSRLPRSPGPGRRMDTLIGRQERCDGEKRNAQEGVGRAPGSVQEEPGVRRPGLEPMPGKENCIACIEPCPPWYPSARRSSPFPQQPAGGRRISRRPGPARSPLLPITATPIPRLPEHPNRRAPAAIPTISTRRQKTSPHPSAIAPPHAAGRTRV
jgi:hypothetical protein